LFRPRASLLLPQPLSPLPSAHLLLAPLPALLASLLPGSGASLHASSDSLVPSGRTSLPFYMSFDGLGGPVGSFGRVRTPFEPETTG